MDHLGVTVSGIPGVHVPLKTDLSTPYNLTSFHKFPGENGWKVAGDGPPKATKYLQPADKRDQQWKFERFAQRWLFFELLRAVLGDLPGFDLHHFVTDDGEWVQTKNLPAYLEQWDLREKSEQDRGRRVARMIRVQQALDTARHFVSKHCAVIHAKENSHWPISPVVSLSFMVLGETLSRAMIRIQQSTDFNVRGWHNHDTALGWGYSKQVLEELEQRGWCPKTVTMFQGLFKGNTIGLLYAIPFAFDQRYHEECTPTVCQAPLRRVFKAATKAPTSASGRKHPKIRGYELRHFTPECKEKGDIPEKCRKLGPRSEDLALILERGGVPLLRYERQTSTLTLVEMTNWNKNYAIFSHVWADGFGNPQKNKIHECVLELFADLFDNIRVDMKMTTTRGATSFPELFWIDTLAIPVGKQFGDQRRKAIAKMHDIYTHARYTIVLDRGLMEKPIERDYAGPAMRITMSAWMTRLWTLQEAVLSRHLYFNFSDSLCSMDRLEEQFKTEDQALHTCIPSVARTFYHGILGIERFRLHHNSVAIDRRLTTSSFVAEVWKASQWRTTAHQHHESLALATLFNVRTDDFADTSNTVQDTSVTRLDLDARMKKLLILLSELDHCAIPPGMIFLPGPRLKDPGFGWAPRSWLSAQEILSPDPLTVPLPEARLGPHGLEVQFTGFLLHSLGDEGYSLSDRSEFHFPTDFLLLEWYYVENADKDIPFPRDEDLTGITRTPRRLAIIAMSLPVVHTKVIAILVAIKRSHSGRHDVEILNRVWLSREGAQSSLESRQNAFRDDKRGSMPCGEKLPPNQRWCVDGPQEAVDSASSTPTDPVPQLAPVRSGGTNLRTQALMIISSFTFQRGRSLSGGSELKRSPSPLEEVREENALLDDSTSEEESEAESG